MNKRAQLEMMQTAFILLILFVLFTLALIFFIGYQKTNLRNKERDIQNLDIVKKSQVLNFMPELQCSFDKIVYHDCYDLEKVMAFKEKYDPNSASYDPRFKEYYGEFFGEVRITYAKYVPEIDNRGWNPLALPPTDPDFDANNAENIIINFGNPDPKRSTRMVQFPVSLYDPMNLKHHFGIIFLEIKQ